MEGQSDGTDARVHDSCLTCRASSNRLQLSHWAHWWRPVCRGACRSSTRLTSTSNSKGSSKVAQQFTWYSATYNAGQLRFTTTLGLHPIIHVPNYMDQYSFTDPWGMDGLSWPCWLIDSGWLNHKGVTRPASSLAQDRESSPAETSVLTTMLRRQLNSSVQMVDKNSFNQRMSWQKAAVSIVHSDR